jgi:hypothetical protein
MAARDPQAPPHPATRHALLTVHEPEALDKVSQSPSPKHSRRRACMGKGSGMRAQGRHCPAGGGQAQTDRPEGPGRSASQLQRMAALTGEHANVVPVYRAQALQVTDVDVSAMAAERSASLLQGAPERDVCMKITPSLRTRGDPRFLRIVLENVSDRTHDVAGARVGATHDVGTTVEAGESARGTAFSNTPGRRERSRRVREGSS